MRLDSFFSGALCVMSGGRLPAALFMVFLLDSKGAKDVKCVNLVDLVKSFQTSILTLYLLANFGVDTAENGPLKVCQQLANTFRINLLPSPLF